MHMAHWVVSYLRALEGAAGEASLGCELDGALRPLAVMILEATRRR